MHLVVGSRQKHAVLCGFLAVTHGSLGIISHVSLLCCRFDCVCQDGFEGVLCGVETDECASNPCQHHGRCYDKLASYDCVCSPGYTGVFYYPTLSSGRGENPDLR